ncbi:MAG: hypothetical protein AAGU27_01800 [Dehalobacterium sp.]
MDIAVCLKQIVDPGSVDVDPLTGKVNEKRAVKITNPSDLCALEAALAIKEQYGGKVSVLCLGPEEFNKSLKEALAMGADQVLRIWEYDWENVEEPQMIAFALTTILKKQHCDLIICGDRGDSFRASEVPAWIAEYMNLPLITGIVDLTVHDNLKSVSIKRKLEKGKRQIMECDLPAVLAVTKYLNQPREYALSNLLINLENVIPVRHLLFGTVAKMLPKNVKKEVRYQVQKLRPEPQLIYTPDGSLSAAERMESLVSGGMVRKKTEFVQGSTEEIILRILEFLKEKEVIHHKNYSEEN